MIIDAVFKEDAAFKADFGVLTRGDKGEKGDKGDKGDTGEVSLAFAEATYAKKAKVESLDKRVTNLEQGILPSPFVTDEGTAYQKSVPTNALPFAEVEKIGGMTRKTENLLNLPQTIEKTQNAYNCDLFTSTAGLDSPVDVAKINTLPYLEAGDYYFNYEMIGATIDSINIVQVNSDGSVATILINTKGKFTVQSGTRVSVRVYTNEVVTIKNIMLNEGEPKPYEPFFEGLRSAPVTEVESVGVNLFEPTIQHKDGMISGCELQVMNGTYIVKPTDGDPYWFPIMDSFHLVEGEQYYFYAYVSNGATCHLWVDDAETVTSGQSFIQSYVKRGHHFELENHTIGQTYEVKIVISKYPIEEYVPFVRNTLPIPSAVQAKNGINEDVYDFIEWREDGTIKNYECVGAVDMGMLDWLKGSPTNDGLSNTFYTRFFSMANRSPLLCSKFTQVVQTGMWEDITNGEMLSANDNYIVVATNHTDATAFKSAMSGVMLYYELANPIITDISDILTEDNYIGVEAGGTITLVNEHQYAVPSSITYQVKGDA